MLGSALRLLCGALILLAACVGRIDEPQSAVVDSDAGPESDAGARSDESPTGGRRDSGTHTPPIANDCPLARGLRMRELAMYQTVKVSLWEDGNWNHGTNRTAAIIRGKVAMARVFVDLDPDYKPHTVRAVLRFREGDTVEELFDTRMIKERSSDEELSTTFNFQIKSSSIGDNAEVSIALEEPTCKGESGPEEATRFPPDGTYQRLEASYVKPLTVKLIPIVSNGRTPEFGPSEREELRKTLLAYYPVPEVNVEVGEPMNSLITIDNTADQPWHDLLQEVIKQRAADQVGKDVYYIGLVQPDDSMRTFCQNGCYLGIAPTTLKRDPTQQVALVAIFPDTPNYESVVHELGHAHGREHAPCAGGQQVPVGADPRYPLQSGAIETWGWDYRTRSLMEPAVHMDVMGYCEPNWISTYTYSALVDRSLEVNGDALFKGVPHTSWRHVLMYANGDVRFGNLDETSRPPGDHEMAQALDASGKVVADVHITRIRLSHSAAQWAFLPRREPGWSAIRLRDRTIELDAIQPAR